MRDQRKQSNQHGSLYRWRFTLWRQRRVVIEISDETWVERYLSSDQIDRKLLNERAEKRREDSIAREQNMREWERC